MLQYVGSVNRQCLDILLTITALHALSIYLYNQLSDEHTTHAEQNDGYTRQYVQDVESSLLRGKSGEYRAKDVEDDVDEIYDHAGC
jgi:hypothetical protein